MVLLLRLSATDFSFTAARKNISLTLCCFSAFCLHGVSYDFYYVTAYIYVDKKAPVHMRTAAQGLITLCCQGFGSLLGYRLGGVMMEKNVCLSGTGEWSYL
ncbi:major facilitator superfamily protein [Citrobacter braakii]|nr:major facilitator superfamily protein [Citrobacter braakii]